MRDRQDLFEIDVAEGLVWEDNPFDGRIFGIDPELLATDQAHRAPPWRVIVSHSQGG